MNDQNADDQEAQRQAVIEELGLSGLPRDKQDELLIKMTEAVLKRIFADSLSRLSEEDQDEYLKMIDAQADQEKIEEFLKSKISNYDELVRKAIVEFKEEMKNV